MFSAGRSFIYAGQTYDIALVWVAVFVLSALAIVMYVTVSWIERMLHKGVKG
jgi:NitT/TauT family transport system permease protein